MRNVIILGSGRSGTSMTAGILARCGYFMGNRVYPADVANPRGYFEDGEINQVNENILAPVTFKKPKGLIGRTLFRNIPGDQQRWLARIPQGTTIRMPSHLEPKVKSILSNVPFCLKDPRFSYTLPAWWPYLENTVFIVVFRHPKVTAASIVKEYERERRSSLKDFYIDFNGAVQIWECMHQHIIDNYQKLGREWRFFHYNQFFESKTYELIDSLLGVKSNREFADRKYNRTTSEKVIRNSVIKLYEHLCQLANYEE